MRFTPLKLPGAYLIEAEPREDERGYFARTWCAREFAEHGLNPFLVQCSVSHNARAGTLRGLHYQRAPRAEDKVISCLRGAMYDVCVDLRDGSATFGRWEGVELHGGSHRSLYLPAGFAHGFQTLVDDTLVYYQMSEYYYPELSAGLRWDDPSLGITWPTPSLGARIMSQRDRMYPLLSERPQSALTPPRGGKSGP